jgi:cobalt/nickel transport protein
MQSRFSALCAGILLGSFSLAAQAHFVVLYTPQTALLRGVDLTFHMVFTHVFNGGPTMSMEKPEKFYYVKRQARHEMSQETDLLPHLESIQWQGSDGESVQAWKATIPREQVRSLGDYQIVVQPKPYFEEEEGLYIQQFTKVMLNVGGVPGNWAETLGLPAEIEALNKPYANWTGAVFRGIVLSDGIPVPYTQVEVEYLNHPLDVANNKFQDQGLIDPPHPAFGAQVILTNEFGEFSFAMPKAGWWGFAALSVGPEVEYEGMPLSQDAILWVQVTDLPVTNPPTATLPE